RRSADGRVKRRHETATLRDRRPVGFRFEGPHVGRAWRRERKDLPAVGREDVSMRGRLAKMLEEEAIVIVGARARGEQPGTLDGGDVIRVGDRVAIGVSARTNEHGARQLADAVTRAGYEAKLCPVEGRLHLASAVTVINDRLVVGTRAGFES